MPATLLEDFAMLKANRGRYLSAGILLLALHSAAAARADFLVTLDVTTSDAGGGLAEYDYFLTDLAASDEPAAILLLSVDPSADLSSISSPDGWENFYSPGDTSIGWVTSDDSFDLAPGQSAHFTFDSPLGPGPQEFLAFGSDAGIVDAPVAGPTAVPEPSALLLLAAGVLGSFGSLRRVRSRCEQ